MLDAKQAVKAASDYLRSVYEGEIVSDIRLEELELDDSSPRWLVTLSFARFPDRDYKQLIVDANNGEVKSMRMVKV